MSTTEVFTQLSGLQGILHVTEDILNALDFLCFLIGNFKVEFLFQCLDVVELIMALEEEFNLEIPLPVP